MRLLHEVARLTRAHWVFAWSFLIANMAVADEPARPVSALGRIEPAGGIVHLAAPNSYQGPSILVALFVADGQSVTNGQELARTHNYASMLAAWQQAQRQAELAAARVTQAESGVKPAERAALDADVLRERATLLQATQDLGRLRKLHEQGALSSQGLDAAEADFGVRSNAVEAAVQRAAAGGSVREVDVRVAQAEQAAAEAQARRAKAEWEQTVICAPTAGRILAIHARIGEQIGGEGLLDFGREDAMDVRAEVFESDIRQVKAGARVEVTGSAFAGTLAGKVAAIGHRVRQNRLLDPNPAAFTDSKVVEVIVRLEDGRPVADLSGALVNVRFTP